MLPEFVIVSDKLLLLPVWMLPKLRLAGLAVIVPGAAAVPDSAMLSVGLEASLPIARLPLTVPPLVGAKVTLNVVLCPAIRVMGRLSPSRVNADPVILACETVTLELPELVSVPDKLALLPT